MTSAMRRSLTASRISRNLICVSFLCCFGIAGTASYGRSQDKIVLIKPGMALPTIVIGASAGPCERFSAQEMATYLEKITGRKIDVVEDGNIPDGKVIAIGKNKLTESIDVSNLEIEQYVIDVKPSVVCIIGGQKPLRAGGMVEDRGTLYGVSEVLETLGVRWYRPEPWGEFVPKSDTIALKLGRNIAPKPVFEMRSTVSGGLTRWRETTPEQQDMAALWAARQRMNYDSGTRHENGGRVTYNFWHSYERYVSADEHFAKHPEYFPLIKGKRTVTESPGRWQICLSNPDVQKLFIEKVVQFAKENPNAMTISAEPSDSWGWCECDLCRAMDDPNDPPELRDPRNGLFSSSNRVCKFNNIVAKELAKQVPGARLAWLAYSQQQRAPKAVDKLEPNTMVGFSTMTLVYTGIEWNDYSKKLFDPSSKVNETFRNLVKDWMSLSPDATFTYEYWGCYAWPGPFPVTRMVADRVRNYPKLGVKGIYNESEPSWGPQGLDLYMTAKLIWNPNLDVEQELNLYYKNYYGPAEKPMKAYHTALMDAFDKIPLCISSGGQGAHMLFTPKLVEEIGKYMDEARRLVKGQPLYERRLEGVYAGYVLGREMCEILKMKKQHGEVVNHPEGGSYLKCEKAETRLRRLENWMRTVNQKDAIFDMTMKFEPKEDDRDIGSCFAFYWRDQVLRNAVWPTLREETLLKDF